MHQRPPEATGSERRPSGWVLACVACGRTRALERAARFAVRLGARSRGKLTLGWCRGCRGPRLIAVRRRRADAAERDGSARPPRDADGYGAMTK